VYREVRAQAELLHLLSWKQPAAVQYAWQSIRPKGHGRVQSQRASAQPLLYRNTHVRLCVSIDVDKFACVFVSTMSIFIRLLGQNSGGIYRSARFK